MDANLVLPTVTIESVDGSFSPTLYRLARSLDGDDEAFFEIPGSELVLAKPADIVGKRATLTLTRDGAPRPELTFAAVIVKATDRRDEDGTRSLELRCEGPYLRLRRRVQSRVFPPMTVEEIVKKVFSEAGETVPLSFTGSAVKRARHYITQYEETDADFLARLLAEHGISSALRFSEAEPTLHFTDAVSKLEAEVTTLSFSPSAGHESGFGIATHVESERSVTADKATVSAYDPSRPRVPGEGEAKEGSGESELYWPLARGLGLEDCRAFADVLLESHLARRAELRVVTTEVNLEPASRFVLEGHPYAKLNAEYVVLSVTHLGRTTRHGAKVVRSAAREVQLFAVPVDAPIRPRPRAPERIARGVQTARTTGGPGEEIDADENGAVTLSFPWDRSGDMTDKSGPRARTLQLATSDSMLLPRVGWEVSVAFHEGDVDQPFVLGRLYNGQSPPPYSLPDKALRTSLQTSTTPGDGSSNEVRFDDTKGNEQMFFNASKDMSLQVGNNTTQNVGNDQKIDVGANQKLTIIDSEKEVIGANQTISVTGNQTLSVATLAVDDVKGDHSASVGGNRMQMIGGDHRRTVDGDSELSVQGSSIEAVIGSVTTTTNASFNHTVGAVQVQVVGGSRSLIVGGARSETTGAAKVIVAKGNRAVEVGALTTQVGGAIVAKISGDRGLSAGAAFNETVGGAEKAEADEIVVEAQAMMTIVMGGATLMLNPAMVSITGADITMDGDLIEVAPLIVTN